MSADPPTIPPLAPKPRTPETLQAWEATREHQERLAVLEAQRERTRERMRMQERSAWRQADVSGAFRGELSNALRVVIFCIARAESAIEHDRIAPAPESADERESLRDYLDDLIELREKLQHALRLVKGGDE